MISDKAYIDPKAKIGHNVTVMPFAYIEGDVEIDDDCVIYPFTSIMNGTRMGKNNKVHQGSVISAIPQDFKYHGGNTLTIIGNNNIIRENVTIARSSGIDGLTATRIADNNFFMEGVHVCHDVQVGYDNVIGYGCKIAGKVIIEDDVILSTNVVINAFARIGRDSMVGANAFVTKDVPPYIIAINNPIEYAGVNSHTMERLGKDEKVIAHIANAYRLVFNGQNDILDVCRQIEQQIPDGKEIRNIVKFLRDSQLGLITKI
ncbi:MAG: acyl-ACP--UDP-N-acetylglucosamine O-acyltransferase [Prevotella sp.]|nr:acyl-ACP--UDP-N-acetylglucosamine O-acyltransferase [Prevotella sp.]